MIRRILGSTGLEVSEVALGTWAFGGDEWGPADDEGAVATIEVAIRAGVNLLDTADVYGFGHSEELLGRVLNGRLSDLILCTKGGNDIYGERSPGGAGKNFSQDYIEKAIEGSLSRLGVDSIDIYLLHNPAPEVLQDPSTFDVLRRLRDQGKIAHYGASVYTEEEARLAVDRGGAEVIMQTYNLLAPRPAAAVAAFAAQRGVGFLGRSVLANGLLTGKYSPDSEFPADDHRSEKRASWLDGGFDRLSDLRAALPEGLSLTRAALAYVLSDAHVSSVVVGARSPDQLADNLAAAEEAPLPQAVQGEIEQLHRRWGLLP